MQISPTVLEDVRRLIAAVLQEELALIEPEALFFDDLGGESLDLLELSFRLDRELGVRVRFNEISAAELPCDERGCLTPAALESLRSRFPFLKLDGFESRPLRKPTDLLTVEAIAGFVQAALAAAASVATVSAGTDDSPERAGGDGA